MARTESHRRYAKRRLRTVPAGQVRVEELAELRRLKRRSGRTWLQLIYMGLGERREDVLNLIRNRKPSNNR